MKHKICIVGGGISGLVAAYKISKSHSVTLFHKDILGGQMSSFDVGGDWRLEKFYHHSFQSDKHLQRLLTDLGIAIAYKRTTTAIYDTQLSSFNNLIDYFRFPSLKLGEKLQMAVGLLVIKYLPWQFMKNKKACVFLPKVLGKTGFDLIWSPLFKKKFGKYSHEVMMPWFQSRLTRTTKLGYMVGGYHSLIKALANEIIDNQGTITKKVVNRISRKRSAFLVAGEEFDRLILAIPPQSAKKINNKSNEIIILGVVCLVLSLKNKLTDYYWININNEKYPFVALIEHTNFQSTQEYNNQHIVYLSIYCSVNSVYYKSSKNELVNTAIPLLKSLNNSFNRTWINNSWLFRDKEAQHIPDANYYRNLPKVNCGQGLFMLSLLQIFPKDRGVDQSIKQAFHCVKLLEKKL